MLDIETAPNIVYVWGLYDQNIAINQIHTNGYVLCWAAKWYEEKGVMFDSVMKSKPLTMLHNIHRLLDQADIVVHYNGKSFDIPTLNKEFLQFGMEPPAPYKQVDLYRVNKGVFRFLSKKLDYIVDQLGIGRKLRHEGHELWVKCMEKQEAAWKKMERYNKRDVTLLEDLYTKLRPWIPNHPNVAAHEDISGCPACGSQNYEQRGYAITMIMKYKRYRCKDCAKWFRGNKTVSDRRGEHFVEVR